ncbi:DUF58 domain-containing protein [Nocardioides sp.]|uniref:DUF58 domain-containing protein n=1 Tax=Nocardioides sp. TaxID=35761 RepID=UPI0035144DFC
MTPVPPTHDGQPPLADPTTSPEAVFAALELALRRRLPGRLHGEHRGLGLGAGSDPEEIVRYRPGEDDVRRIDWNATSRAAGEPHVWRTQAQHELESWVLVDRSPSMAFGTVNLPKNRLADGVVGAVALLTQGPGNRVGTLEVTATGLRWAAPVPARAAAHRALRQHHHSPDDGVAPPLADALVALARRYPRPGLRVVVSDLLDADGGTARPFAWERPLRRLAAVHDVLVVEVLDPRELALPDVGVVTLLDPESGRTVEVDTRDRRLRETYAATAAAHRDATRAAVRGARAEHVVLRTDRDWVRDLARALGSGPRRRTPAAAGTAGVGA